MEKNKEINILKTFICWCLTGLIICVLGITGVLAAEYNFDYSYTQSYYDNNGSSVTNVGASWNESLQAYVSNNITTTANSYGGGVAFNSPIPLIANHTYSMSLSFVEKNNIALSSKNKISCAFDALTSANNYAVNNFNTETIISRVTNNSILSFVFKPNQNFTYIFVPFTTTFTTTQNYILTSVIIDDLGNEGISQNDINNSLNNQTTIITNNLNALENSLNNSINDMGEDISNSINDNFNSCRESNNLVNIPKNFSFNVQQIPLVLSAGTYYLSVGEVLKGSTANVVVAFNDQPIQLTSNLQRSFTINSDITSFYIYSSGYNYNASVNITSTINNFMISKEDTYDYEEYGEKICKNRIDETNDKLDEGEKTRKGILASIKEIPEKIGDMFKGLFIPEEEDLEEIIDDFKEWAENKFGILYDSIDIVIQFITNFNNITEGNDVIIHIPNINVPNFEDYVIIEEQDFNWSALLRSKESINALWVLYLDFIDVFIIIAFLNMCENVFSGITGEPQEPTDQIYESEGESYDVNDATGEVTNHKIWRKESRRKR